MMFEIWMTQSAEQAYSKLDLKTRKRIEKVIKLLSQGDFNHQNITKLEGKYKDCFRYRMGQWRIIFRLDHQKRIVIINTIIPRGDAYKN